MVSSATFLLSSTLLAYVSLHQVLATTDPEQAIVAGILSQLSTLIREEHHIVRPTVAQNAAPTRVGDSLRLIFDNDMILSTSQANMLLNHQKLRMSTKAGKPKRESKSSRVKRILPGVKWAFPIKYAFDGSHTAAEQAIIRQGLAMWQADTCVSFQEFASAAAIGATSGIVFNKGNGCTSRVGRASTTATQGISLGNGCVYPGITAHEVGHALGLWHEHMRFDRDDYLTINYTNMIAGYESAFSLVPAGRDVTWGTNFDYTSIMMYDSLGYSVDYWGKKRVVIPDDWRFLTSLGQRGWISFNDAKRVNSQYNCTQLKCAGVTLAKNCMNGGYQDPKNCAACRCPSGYGGPYCGKNAAAIGATCGGVINVGSCSTTTLSSPSYPNKYPAGSSCSWMIKAPLGSGLVFGFESQPDMTCNAADTCNDFVEIRFNTSDLTFPGPRFCTCGLSNGRVASTDSQVAVVHFKSYSSTTPGKGFRLYVYATCSGTLPSALTDECRITPTGFDYDGVATKTTDSGTKCVKWSGQATYDDLDFPDGNLTYSVNYCRNPAGSGKSTAWCYTNAAYSASGSCSTISACPTSAKKRNYKIESETEFEEAAEEAREDDYNNEEEREDEGAADETRSDDDGDAEVYDDNEEEEYYRDRQ